MITDSSEPLFNFIQQFITAIAVINCWMKLKNGSALPFVGSSLPKTALLPIEVCGIFVEESR